MRKRLMSVLLAAVMLFGLMVPTHAATAADGFAVDLEAVTSTTTDLKVNMKLTAKTCVGLQGITFVYDSNKLQLSSLKNGSEIKVTTSSLSALANTGPNAGRFENPASASAVNVYAATLDNGKNLVKIEVNLGTDSWEDYAKDGLEIAAFGLKFVNGTTLDTLSPSDFYIAKQSEAASKNALSVAMITDADNNSYLYGKSKSDAGVITDDSANDNLAKPKIMVNGTELVPVVTLTGITLTAGATTATVPTGNTAATIAAPTLAPVPSDASTTGITFGLYTTADGTTAFTKTGVSVNASTGAVTVAKGASGSLSDGANKCYLIASKGGIKSNAIELTITKTAAEATVVSVSPTSGTATLKAGGGANDVNAAITVKDQYGNTMSGQTPTVTGAPTGVTWANGKFSFDNTARATTSAQTVTFTVNGKTATFALTIKKGTQSAPTSPTGVKTSAVGSSDGKITGVTTAMEYSSNGTSYTPCTGTEITGLAKGTYKVRFAATDYLDASPAKDVSVGEPGKTDDPTVTITPATVELTEGGSQVLTANVTPSTGTITYKWYKDNVEVSGQTNKELTVTEAGTYKVEVTRKAAGEAVSNAVSATATVTVKGKTAVTVAKKATASQSAGALNVENLVTVTGAKWADVKDNVTAKVFRLVEDKETGAKTYEEVTGSLEEGTYYVSIGVTAKETDDFKLAEVTAPADPTDPITEADYVKLTVTKGGSSGIVIGGGSSNSYTVKFNAGAHGTLSGSTSVSVKKGETITTLPTVTANAGYTFRGWSTDGKTVVDPTTVKITASTTFTALYNAVKNTYISGYPDGSFRPDATVTRAEIASMLARLSKDFNANTTYSGSANDVASTAWYANFVNFGMQKGIISGHQDGGFHPDANITRAEFASMLARYLGLNGGSKQFSDTADHWAKSSIAALADAGIVNGRPNGGFDPNASLTRAEAVQMINVALKVTSAGVEYEVVPNDVPSTHWAYNQILTAMNSDIKDIVK